MVVGLVIMQWLICLSSMVKLLKTQDNTRLQSSANGKLVNEFRDANNEDQKFGWLSAKLSQHVKHFDSIVPFNQFDKSKQNWLQPTEKLNKIPSLNANKQVNEPQTCTNLFRFHSAWINILRHFKSMERHVLAEKCHICGKFILLQTQYTKHKGHT